MVVVQPLDKDSKLNLTLKEAKEICINRNELLGEDACNICMFHDKDGCQIEGMPKYWLEEEKEEVKNSV